MGVEQGQGDLSGNNGPGYSLRARGSKAAALMRRAAGALGDFIYPPACPACREEIAGVGGVCAACWREVTFISSASCAACGAPVSPELDQGAVCDACADAPPAWSGGAAAVVYEGAGRSLVLALKHGDRLDIAPLAARWMMAASGGRGADLVAAADVIAPVPLHWRRMAARRFNQAGELAREIAIAADRPGAAALDLLIRRRFTGSQDGKTPSERHQNVTGVFTVAARRRGALAGRRILIVDDVMTTGATISACAEACRASGAAEVTALVFARVARGDRPD